MATNEEPASSNCTPHVYTKSNVKTLQHFLKQTGKRCTSLETLHALPASQQRDNQHVILVKVHSVLDLVRLPSGKTWKSFRVDEVSLTGAGDTECNGSLFLAAIGMAAKPAENHISKGDTLAIVNPAFSKSSKLKTLFDIRFCQPSQLFVWKTDPNASVPVQVPVSASVPVPVPVHASVSVPASVSVQVPVPASAVPVPASVPVAVPVPASVSVPVPVHASVPVPVPVRVPAAVPVPVRVPASVPVPVPASVPASVPTTSNMAAAQTTDPWDVPAARSTDHTFQYVNLKTGAEQFKNRWTNFYAIVTEILKLPTRTFADKHHTMYAIVDDYCCPPLQEGSPAYEHWVRSSHSEPKDYIFHIFDPSRPKAFPPIEVGDVIRVQRARPETKKRRIENAGERKIPQADADFRTFTGSNVVIFRRNVAPISISPSYSLTAEERRLALRMLHYAEGYNQAREKVYKVLTFAELSTQEALVNLAGRVVSDANFKADNSAFLAVYVEDGTVCPLPLEKLNTDDVPDLESIRDTPSEFPVIKICIPLAKKDLDVEIGNYYIFRGVQLKMTRKDGYEYWAFELRGVYFKLSATGNFRTSLAERISESKRSAAAAASQKSAVLSEETQNTSGVMEVDDNPDESLSRSSTPSPNILCRNLLVEATVHSIADPESPPGRASLSQVGGQVNASTSEPQTRSIPSTSDSEYATPFLEPCDALLRKIASLSSPARQQIESIIRSDIRLSQQKQSEVARQDEIGSQASAETEERDEDVIFLGMESQDSACSTNPGNVRLRMVRSSATKAQGSKRASFEDIFLENGKKRCTELAVNGQASSVAGRSQTRSSVPVGMEKARKKCMETRSGTAAVHGSMPKAELKALVAERKLKVVGSIRELRQNPTKAKIMQITMPKDFCKLDVDWIMSNWVYGCCGRCLTAYPYEDFRRFVSGDILRNICPPPCPRDILQEITTNTFREHPVTTEEDAVALTLRSFPCKLYSCPLCTLAHVDLDDVYLALSYAISFKMQDGRGQTVELLLTERAADAFLGVPAVAFVNNEDSKRKLITNLGKLSGQNVRVQIRISSGCQQKFHIVNTKNEF